MKAIILAAGLGKRLKGIAERVPKPMINFKGKPLLQHNIELCKKFNVNEIFINIHHLADNITNYFGDGSRFGVKILYSVEKQLLGTAGAVRKIFDDLWEHESNQITNGHSSPNSTMPDGENSEPFFLLYGDNYSNFNLNLLKEKYFNTNPLGVIAFHYRMDVTNSGVAEFGNDFKVISFIEKPKSNEASSHWVNAGIYLLNPKVVEFIPHGFSDFGRDIFPKLLKEGTSIYGVCQDTEVIAFDTLEMYNKAIGKQDES